MLLPDHIKCFLNFDCHRLLYSLLWIAVGWLLACSKRQVVPWDYRDVWDPSIPAFKVISSTQLGSTIK